MTMIEADAEMIMTGTSLHTETETVVNMMTVEVRETLEELPNPKDDSAEDRILYCENEWCTFNIHIKVCVFRISHDKGRSRQKKWLPKRQGRRICYR